ncbi:ACP S-malonyltransferase [Metabacillus idriensis]|uniref:[acyl-carrier-protein] S-malonyltransferase n=1 Tax=Metabacillus idriensis TaxID=324768 RepID=A0A6I2MD28_9BACI|nr:ACP S-malonyltransferase [Metabacillus idriensis]MCM3598073.1 ACP S-malonyltransferase [Metabacillus idriensis]MRX56178.1 ACP S-malonyltransferase [Metabacillus idriensis]
MKKLGLLFPGQGSQYIGMGKELYEEFEVVRHTFEEASNVLNFDLKELCFNGDINTLTMTANAQPAILTVSVAAYRVLMQELNLFPEFGAGHSLGEFSALTCTGAISFSDAVKIVHHRGTLMQDAVAPGEGAMVAIMGLNEWDIESICLKASSNERKVVIANYNSSNQVVISGHADAVERAKVDLEKMGARTIPLNVSAPFHSPLMTTAAKQFGDELTSYNYSQFQWPVISNYTGTPYKEPRFIVSNLTSQMAQPVQWQKSIQYMVNKGVATFIEIGPKSVLKNLMNDISKSAKVFSLEYPTSIKNLKETKIEAKPDGLALITSCIAVAVSTQNKNWNNDEYDKGVVVPYKQLEELREQLIAERKEPTKEQMHYAIDLLKTIFETKLTPIEIQEERFNQIFYSTHTRDHFSEFKVGVVALEKS